MDSDASSGMDNESIDKLLLKKKEIQNLLTNTKIKALFDVQVTKQGEGNSGCFEHYCYECLSLVSTKL